MMTHVAWQRQEKKTIKKINIKYFPLFCKKRFDNLVEIYLYQFSLYTLKYKLNIYDY